MVVPILVGKSFVNNFLSLPPRPSSSSSSPQSRSESMASVHSQDGGRYGTVAVRGEVEFGLLYSVSAGALEVGVKQCRELAAVDAKRSRSDP